MPIEFVAGDLFLNRVKAEAFMHLTPNITYPLMIVVSALMLPVMIVRFYMGIWQMVFIDLPLIAARRSGGNFGSRSAVTRPLVSCSVSVSCV